MKQGHYSQSPPRNILLWILAYNALQNNAIAKDKIYTTKELYNLSEFEINKLAKSLGMKKNNIDNIQEILLYMGKLHGDLDFGNKQHKDLWETLLLNSDFDGVISLLKSDPNTHDTIIKLLPQIIKRNLDTSINYDMRFKNFMSSLIKLNYPDLIDESLKIYSDLFYDFVKAKNLDIYFENIPVDLDENKLLNLVEKAHDKAYDTNEETYFIYEVLKYARNNDKEIIEEYIGNIIDNLPKNLQKKMRNLLTQ
jgi:hypothetical protein